ncbi:MAG: molecular chaperone TorD, partial [Methylotenera sp.]
LTDALQTKLERKVELISKTPSTIEALSGAQSGIWGLFGDMIVVSWVFADTKPEYAAAAKQDAQAIANQLTTLITELGLPTDTATRYALHEGKLLNQSSLAAQWRTLFAQAVIKLEHENNHEDLA